MFNVLVALQSNQLLWVGKGRKGDPDRHSSSMISSYNCTFFYLAPAFSKPHRSHAGKTLWKSIWNYLSRVDENWLFQCACRCWPLSLFDILHYTGFVCTNEWSCSPVTDLKRLITTDSCRNSLFAREIKMCVLEPKNQTVRTKYTEADDKTPTSFSGTEFTPSQGSWWMCAVVPHSVVPSLPRGSAWPHAHTAMSGVISDLRPQSGLLSKSVLTFSVGTEVYGPVPSNEWEQDLVSYPLPWDPSHPTDITLLSLKCTLLFTLLLEFSASIPKCVKTKIIQSFHLTSLTT